MAIKVSNDWGYIELLTDEDAWLQTISTSIILDHLERQRMIPIYRHGNKTFVRLELIPLVTKKICIEDIQKLLDHRVSKAEELMGTESYFIHSRDRVSTANSKVSLAEGAYNNSCRRLQDINTVKKSTNLRQLAEAVERARENIPELSDFVEDMFDPELSISWNPLYFISTIRRRDAVLSLVKKKIHILWRAIKYENTIHANRYRILLAMLMIHSSNRGSSITES